MKLFIDTERLRDLNSGLGQFCLRLGGALVELRPLDTSMTFLVPSVRRGIFGEAVDYRSVAWWRKLWSPGRYDLWHCTHQDSAFLPPPSTRFVLTIHDLNFLGREDYDDAKKARKLAELQHKVDRADAVTAISEYTASVVRKHLRLGDRPVYVIYNGNTPAGGPEAVAPAFLSPAEGPFFLFVGVIHPKKNCHTLLPLLEAFPDWRLVLAGADAHPYAAHIRQQAELLGVADRLVMPGVVEEGVKRWLYENCGAFLFPSLAEGFGLPVVEAMSYGKPVFLSRLTSLPEVGGTDAYYFDSFEPESMAETVFEGLSDFAANPFRADRLRRQAARFSWERAAGEYWEVYTKIAEGPRSDAAR